VVVHHDRFVNVSDQVDIAVGALSKLWDESSPRRLAEGAFQGLDGQPIERYVRLVQDNKNNMRAVRWGAGRVNHGSGTGLD
jgi:hypothetical protein